MEVGERLQRWLIAKGVGCRELARRIGVSGPAVVMWTNGINRPTLAHLEKACKALGITTERFFGDVPEPRKAKR